jgi:hypothetical protein
MKSFPILAALVLAGCSTAPPPPRLSSVTPSRVSAFLASDLVIRGEGIDYAVTADLDRPAESTFTLELHVRLVGPETVELLPAERVSTTEVTARVPASLKLGKYTVEVSTARGVGKLINGLEVTNCFLDCERPPDDGGCFTWPDSDGDGYGKLGAGGAICLDDAGTRVAKGGDCRDRDPATHPDAFETCNALDDDCDGRVDDGACLPDAGWKLRSDTGSFGNDWQTAANYGRGNVWLAEKQRVVLRPGSGSFSEVSPGCGDKLVCAWADPAGVAYLGGEGVLRVHALGSPPCGKSEPVNGTVAGLQGFGTRVFGATTDGQLLDYAAGMVSQRTGFGPDASVSDVQGSSEASLFAVGNVGGRPMVWRMTTDGGAVADEGTALLGVPDQNLSAVWAVDDRLAYAVGAQGALLERTDGGWHALTAADGGLRAVRAFGFGRVYAATADGRVLRFNGERWELLYRHPLPIELTDITASAEDDLWVVGHDGVVLHWNE